MKRIARHRRLFAEGSWVAFGQVGAAVGTLIGIRLLTEFAPPDVYGEMTLVIGVVALGLGAVFTPVLQAALRFYPEYAEGRVPLLRKILGSILWKRSGATLLLLLASWPFVRQFHQVTPEMGVLVFALLILDGLRSLEMSLLNAARRQRSYAVVSVLEAWGRPVAAMVALRVLESGTESILIGYALVTSLILFCFYLLGKPEGAGRPLDLSRLPNDLRQEVRSYSWPLVPMAMVGWVSGVGDRYLIGGLLGLHEAGIYAAVYGLLSRPFLMASGVIELTLRPIYNQRVANGAYREANALLRQWLLAVASVMGVGLLAILLLDDFIVNILLAEEYRSSTALMPWIASGYFLLALSHVFEKVCYAFGNTGYILFIQCAGAVFGIGIAYLGIVYYGLLGAAMAVPVYFGLQMALSVFMARKSDRSSRVRGFAAAVIEPGAGAA